MTNMAEAMRGMVEAVGVEATKNVAICAFFRGFCIIQKQKSADLHPDFVTICHALF